MKTEVDRQVIEDFKISMLDKRIRYNRDIRENPRLNFLFLELTVNCNERCLHCGSNCGDVKAKELTLADYMRILNEVKEDFTISDLMLCITGGEPLLKKDFFKIMSYANALGYNWGMTSNGSLITKDVAHKLAECGMKTISVSIDGLRETHDAFRQTPGAYDRAMEGIQNLIDEKAFHHIQVTTVVTHQNLQELDALYETMLGLDIDSWRVIGIEPIGRALLHPELLLTDEDNRILMDFIRDKRADAMPVTYGCSHFLGLTYEGEVRDFYYSCGAGKRVASITAEGDLIACLDLPRRPELVQGNVKHDRIKQVWEERYQIFRQPLSDLNDTCSECASKEYCLGGSFHSWDFDHNQPMVCFKNSLPGFEKYEWRRTTDII